MQTNGSIVGDVIKGGIAGVVGTWVMGQVTTYMWEHEDPAARERYQEVTGGKYVPDRTAEKIGKILGVDLSEEQHRMLAEASHWGLGAGVSAAYALLRRRYESADWGQGLWFGLLFWAIVDEGMTPLFGLAEMPQVYPWQAHARGFVGHLVFGVVADTVLDVFDRAS